MYDACGVRLHAGRQAEVRPQQAASVSCRLNLSHAQVLNQIIYELPPEHPVRDTRPLRDTLGHTVSQVAAGGALGCAVALARASAHR